MKITIHITKEVLKNAMFCSPVFAVASTNCAIARAIIKLFPDARTSLTYITPYPCGKMIFLPTEASDFIRKFDSLADFPEQRIELPELSFEIDVPEEVINQIGINEVREILSESKTLSEVLV